MTKIDRRLLDGGCGPALGLGRQDLADRPRRSCRLLRVAGGR
jgi:hypothetical protein